MAKVKLGFKACRPIVYGISSICRTWRTSVYAIRRAISTWKAIFWWNVEVTRTRFEFNPHL